jgi:hypothetical protein
MSWIESLQHAQVELRDCHVDPWRNIIERGVPANVVCTSSVALLDLVGVPHTTGNCRRLALTMRAMGWVGIKSRRLSPGGWRTTTCRGWARALRETGSKEKDAYHV